VNRRKAARPRFRWLVWLVVAAALAAGGYLFFNRPGHLEPVAGGVIASPFPSGQRRNVGSPLPIPKPGTAPFPPGFKVVEQKVVELNSATLAEVETLPGITPDYARKIIAGRPYQSIADLGRTGIPRSILDELSPPAVIRVTQRGLPPPTSAPAGKPQ
jgi:Helix-hairpin-helix motif